MRVPLLLTVVIIALFSCNHDKNELQYLLSRMGEIDTISMEIIDQQVNDSVSLIKYRVHGDKMRDNEPYEQEYQLPREIHCISQSYLRLVYERTIEFEGRDYSVLKYQLDIPDSEDEESVFFYCPDFGIILLIELKMIIVLGGIGIGIRIRIGTDANKIIHVRLRYPMKRQYG